MSFKGIVTRKEKDTGVTLLAKVVSPNKKKSTKKQYKIRVIANGMSDREACNRDLIWMKNNFYEQGVVDLQSSLNFIPIGQYGTNIAYNIVNDSVDVPLTDFLDKNTGKLLGKPVFGQGDATGRIQIIVSKGQETLTGVVAVVIKAYTAFEVLHNSNTVNATGLWTAIANGNSPYYLLNGKVTLIQSWEPWKGSPLPPSNEPIGVSWKIEDKLVSLGIVTSPRVSTSSNLVSCPDYTVISTALQANKLGNVNVIEGISPSYSEYSKVLKMDGLTLQATLTLGSETVVLEPFSVYTNTLPLTNEEVMSEVESQVEVLNNGNSESLLFRVYSGSGNNNGEDLGGYIIKGSNVLEKDDREQITRIDASRFGTTVAIRILSSQSLSRVVLNNLQIGQGKFAGTVANADINGPVLAFNGTDSYSINPIVTQSVFDWATREEVTKDTLLIINLATLKELVESGETDAVYFCVKQTLRISQYDGSESFTTISRQFAIDNIDSVVMDAAEVSEE